jgi:hypothetical protein
LTPPAALARQQVARTGDLAVGTPGKSYGRLEALGFTAGGALLFGVHDDGVTGAADGIWRWTSEGGAQPILLGGDDTSYGSLVRAVVNGDGDFAYEGTRPGPPEACAGMPLAEGPTDALWLANAEAAPVQIWRTGDAAPDAPDGLHFLRVDHTLPYDGAPRLSSSGVLVFGAVLTTDVCAYLPIERSAIFQRDAAGVVHLVAAEGAPAPGATDGGRFETFFWERGSLHESGRFVFRATLENDGGQVAGAIYRYDALEGLAPVAIGPWEDPLVHTGTGYYGAQIGDDGTIYFNRNRVESFVETAWALVETSDGGATIDPLLAKGDILPDPEASIAGGFSGIGLGTDGVALNGAGDVAFLLTLAAGSSSSWAIVEIDEAGALTVRLHGGDPAPDSGDIAIFGDLPAILAYAGDGSLLIDANLARVPIDVQRALFLLRRDGSVQRFANLPGTSGVVLDAAASTVAALEVITLDEGYEQTLYVAAVPEPAASGLALAALLSVAGMRRRRCAVPSQRRGHVARPLRSVRRRFGSGRAGR